MGKEKPGKKPFIILASTLSALPLAELLQKKENTETLVF